MPPDFGNANIVLGIIGAGAALVAFFYSYQVWLKPMIDSLISFGPTAEERAADLLVQYHEENRELYGLKHNVAATSPRLHLLRTAESDDGLRCLVVNRGGRASNLRIVTDGAIGSIEPEQVLESGQTCSLSFNHLQTAPTLLRFQISYEDSLGLNVVRTYEYSEQEKNFIEV